MLSQLIAEGKTDAQIKLALNRPTLDMPYFRKRYAKLSISITAKFASIPALGATF
jgi:hypothetical protein